MTPEKTKNDILSAIQSFSEGNVTQKGVALFEALGYITDRQANLDSPVYEEFRDNYIIETTRFNETNALVADWKYVDILFQLSKEEVLKQTSLFDTKQVDRTIIETYLFITIELSGKEYTRTQLSQITREVNRVFPMPVLILFKYNGFLTLSVINRRLHKRDESKDVLEKVTQIKDIRMDNPHRAHIEILFDLSFDELNRKFRFTNFVELHNAWQKTLDIKELNKRFYSELQTWFFWAIKEVTFPGTPNRFDYESNENWDEAVKEHKGKNIIRLLTRILFVWFIKEKKLIPEQIFDENILVTKLLREFEPQKPHGIFATGKHNSLYYRAILQNLFFATLNQEMGKREFRKDGQNQNATNLMRYKSYFKDSEYFLELMESVVPFMNGGLFECLDKPHPTLKGKMGGDIIIYNDGFSDREDNELQVPDYLFFDVDEDVDLSEEIGSKDKAYKNAKTRGLLEILKSYKFTITENTPIEEDVALDPELLGKVFENLLASYNPETKTTARKQTGSFYTPREIVNYMVDESLIAYLKNKFSFLALPDEKLDSDLHDLLSYNEINPFATDNTLQKQLIAALDDCTILDPACGSGAFPMGILHKMVHVLHKIDPNNTEWKQRQIEKAEMIDDDTTRDKAIRDIEESFANNELDYGRKLYLIENCIYGVDIQPIATQISKLRFFISLIVDQCIDKNKPNFGIRPLPNLETKFVAANTLIGIEKPKLQLNLFENKEVKRLEDELKKVRHRLFSAKVPATKRKLREDDKLLREQLAEALIQDGWANNTARQLAGWDPYDQNVHSDFFDTEWMFGLNCDEKHTNLKNSSSFVINAQIEAINTQIEAVNISFCLNHSQEIIKLQLLTAFLQANIIELELIKIKNEVEKLYGEINSQIGSVVREKDNIDYTVNALNANIKQLNKQLKAIKTENAIESKSNGYFDIVIGNPPYIQLQANKSKLSKLYKNLGFKTFFKTGDIYCLFYELGNNLLKQNGVLSYITPNTWLQSITFDIFRKYMTSNFNWNRILLADKVFEAVVDTNSVVFTKQSRQSECHIFRQFKDYNVFDHVIPFSQLQSDGKSINIEANSIEVSVYEKIVKRCKPLSTYFEVYNGVKPFEKGKGTPPQTAQTMQEKPFVAVNCEKPDVEWKPLLRGSLMNRYVNLWNQNSWILYGEWLAAPRNPKIFEANEKVVVRQTGDSIIATEIGSGIICRNNLHICISKSKYKSKTLLGFLNSRLIDFVYSYINPEKGEALAEIKKAHVEALPIPNLKTPNQKKLEEIVEQILLLKQENHQSDTTDLERQIDEMVFKLYDLKYSEVLVVCPDFWLSEEEYAKIEIAPNP